MRVLVLTSERPPLHSGIANSVGQQVDGLRARGHAVDVLAAMDFPRWMVGEFRLTGVLLRWGRLAPLLPGYDVINVHGPVPSMSDALLLAIRALPPLLRPPLVYTHHSNIELPGLERLSRGYNQVHEWLTRCSDQVVVTTPSYRDVVQARSPVPVSVIPWGVDLERFGRSQQAGRRREGPLKVLFVGQMRPYKGIVELLAAVRGLDSVVLTVAGSGPLLGHCRRLAEGSATTVLGRVPDEDLPRRYAEADVVVLPSTTTAEAFGLVLLEGMASGCVPVASDLPGVRDLVGRSGVLVRPGDAMQLRRELHALATDPERMRRLRGAARIKARQYTIPAVAAGYEEVFRRAVDGWQARYALAQLRPGWQRPAERVRELARAFGADNGALLLVDRTLGANVRSSWGMVEGEPTDHPELAHPKAAPRLVARSGRPVIVNHAPDPGTGPGIRGDADAARPLWPHPSGGSELHLPVTTRRGSSAVLSLRRPAGRSSGWTDADIRPVHAAARAIGEQG